MHRLAKLRAVWLLLLLGPAGVVGLPTPTSASDPTSTAATKDPQTAVENDPSATMDRALGFERKHLWTSAVQVYRDARVKWPSRNEFKQRLHLCEMHLRLSRRYGDQSFRNVLLRLSREKSIDLFDEMVERIESHYVDPVALEPLFRRGLDNLEVALRDPNFAFLKINAPNATPERLAWLREQLRARREVLAVADRDSARAQVIEVCDLARQAVGIPPSAVVLEFVFGTCDVLDEYTTYLTPDKLDDMFAMIDGNFVGLGVELKQDDQGLRLVGVIRGGPAFEAGLKPGDRIVAVGGVSVKGLGLDEAAGRLQGTEGTIVEVGVKHANATNQSYRLVRRHVEVESIAQAKILEGVPGVGYVQLIGFQKTSTEELDRAMTRLQRQGMRYLILDLRGNPGGLLNVAVDIADKFVDQGIIVSTKGRAPGQTQVFRAKPDQPYKMDMAVLIDRDSASASEILAGALQELKRATVIGNRSFGKGSVQSIFELRSVPAGLKLTTAKFYSPLNRPYSEQGVTPDIENRVTARPVYNEGGDADDDPKELGDPATDIVLKMALDRARGDLTKR